jgi:hypothetical protein
MLTKEDSCRLAQWLDLMLATPEWEQVCDCLRICHCAELATYAQRCAGNYIASQVVPRERLRADVASLVLEFERLLHLQRKGGVPLNDITRTAKAIADILAEEASFFLLTGVIYGVLLGAQRSSAAEELWSVFHERAQKETVQ